MRHRRARHGEAHRPPSTGRTSPTKGSPDAPHPEKDGALVAASAALTAAATATATSATAAPDDTLRRYIVVLDSGSNAGAVASEQARSLGVLTGHVYSSALDGYAAWMPAAVADRVAADPRVA